MPSPVSAAPDFQIASTICSQTKQASIAVIARTCGDHRKPEKVPLTVRAANRTSATPRHARPHVSSLAHCAMTLKPGEPGNTLGGKYRIAPNCRSRAAANHSETRSLK